MMDKHKIEGHSAVLLANVIFGLGVPVTKLLLDEWVSPMAYMATRCMGAAAIFWLISLFMPRERVERRDLLVIMGGGLLGFVVSQTLTAWALHFTTPVYFSIIATLTPVATMVCAALLIGERLSLRGALGVAIGVVGALLMVMVGWQVGSGMNDLLGIGLAVLSLLTWAVYLIITRKVSVKYTAVTQMKWVFLVSTLAVLPFSWTDLQASRLYSSQWAWSGVAEMAFIVVFATVAGFFAIPFALRYLKTTTVSVYTNLQPVVASFVAIAIGQDLLSWDKPVSLALVLLSAWIVTNSQQKG
ncbi:DMT family transporter [Hallella sp.]|uniref:DMT family transporter n=1 Tax=Hallella TaxID=52228 RepID=UPI00284D3B51|nr:DMT family transporter [Hallella sp.]MCI7433006.1 DMT family transporter [Prevotella sp.]MDR3845594.1 DMT family transporter [Hallella sp.]MDR4000505.1 DMT family transporter [Hallella sp.]MDY5924716.1 DMT family transporter [Hallella sp.]MED9945898.1 DMT family transporter [Hallella sp.]